MTSEEKNAYMGLIRRRYATARTKKGHGRILGEVCEVSGLTRKHVINQLSPKREKFACMKVF